MVEKNYSKAKKVNCDGTRNLINALIKHKKKLPTPHDLITKGKILEKWMPEKGDGCR